MSVISKSSAFLLPLVALAVPVGVLAQQGPVATDPAANGQINVYGDRIPDPATMTKGPEVEGIITARKADRIQVVTADGSRQTLAVNNNTKVKASGGFLSSSQKLGPDALVNGLPVTVSTLQFDGGLFASSVSVKKKDVKFAAMIHNGTDQRFAENEAATEALRSRVADIDNYNVKNTVNVNFDTGKAALSEAAKADLCATANTAQSMDNALILVVGYTDSTGSQELNQALSEKRATNVVNYLQQACHWKPYRMLTPTGMAEADPLADNETPYGKAQNRRVAVNILVSKAVDGFDDDGWASNTN